MKITSIKHQAKNPQRVSIFIDGKYGFSLSLDELLAEKLKKDDEIDDERLNKLKKLSEDGKRRMRALEWVMGRPHSVREFRDYMYRKKADSQLTDNLIEEFTGKKYLDDKAYGSWLADLRQRAGKSDRQIRSELYAKGLSREDVEIVMQGQEAGETERLRALIDKKSKLIRYQNDPQKLAKYLLSQGFSYSDIKAALALNRQ